MTNDEEDSMSELYQSISHYKWDCKYHVVFVPKRRRKMIFGQTRRQLGPIFTHWRSRKGARSSKGTSCQTMCIAIPPKHPVASVIGFFSRGRVLLRSPGCASADLRYLGRALSACSCSPQLVAWVYFSSIWRQGARNGRHGMDGKERPIRSVRVGRLLIGGGLLR